MQNPLLLPRKERRHQQLLLVLKDPQMLTPESLAKTLLESILSKQALEPVQFLGNRVRLNNFNNLSEPELHYLIGQYQKKYISLSSLTFTVKDKRFRNNRLTMRGSHETGCCFEHHCEIIKGNWRMELRQQEGEWLVVSIDVEGVDF